jgi:NADH:ubiquinone oxidoreductase subunit H
LGVFLALLVWVLIPYLSGFISFKLGLLLFLACARLGVYAVMITGWSSNSGYSLLGALRAFAQTISYEIRLAFILYVLFHHNPYSKALIYAVFFGFISFSICIEPTYVLPSALSYFLPSSTLIFLAAYSSLRKQTRTGM